jgi:hypothetical protein
MNGPTKTRKCKYYFVIILLYLFAAQEEQTVFLGEYSVWTFAAIADHIVSCQIQRNNSKIRKVK